MTMEWFSGSSGSPGVAMEWISGSAAELALIDRTAGADIGDMTLAGGLAAAFDGETDRDTAACAVAATASAAYVGKALASARVFGQAVAFGSNDFGFLHTSDEVTLTIYGRNGGAPSAHDDGTALGSLTFTDTGDESAGRVIDSTDLDTQWDYLWLAITTAGSPSMYCAELQLLAWDGPTGFAMVWDPTVLATVVTPRTRPLDWIEVEVDRCQLVYGTAPCEAVLGVTGEHKCFNGIATCQDPENYDPAPYWVRFAEGIADLPRLATFEGDGLPWWLPLLDQVRHTPVKPDPGRSIGVRAELRCTLQDAPYHDRAIDKYAGERNFDGATRSTFALKLLTRFPHYVGRRLRWRRGWIGEEPVTRHYVIERIEGPDRRGRVTIIAKDPLKLADDKRAQAPVPSRGVLDEDIADATSPTTIDIATPDAAAYDVVQKGWRRLDGIVGGAAISGNALAMVDTGAQGTAYALAEDLGSADHYCQCTRAQAGDASHFELAVRVTDRDNFIGLRYVAAGSGWEMQRNVAGTLTLIGSSATPTPAAGDVIRLEAEGDQIRVYVNEGLAIGPVTEPAHQAVTGVGLVARNTASDPALDDYEAGTVASGARTRRFFENFQRGDDSLEGTQVVLIGSEGFSYTGTTVPLAGIVRLTGVARALPGGYATEAEAHDTGDTVQLALWYNQERLVDIVADLLTGYVPGFDPSWVPTDEWDDEHDTWLSGQTLTRLIAEPEGVSSLINEIVEQTLTWAFWWDEAAQLVRYRAVRPPDLNEAVPALSDDRSLIGGSVERIDEPERIANIVQVVYGQVDPTAGRDERENYRKVSIRADADSLSASQVGQQRIRRIFARWHPIGNVPFIDQFTTRTLASGASKTYRIEFDLARQDGEELALAGFVRLETAWIVDVLGLPERTRMQLVYASADRDALHFRARADVFGGARVFGRIAPGHLTGQAYAASSEFERNRYFHIADAFGLMSDGSDGYRLL